MLPPLIRGEHKACFAVTEPDAGLDTTALKTKAERHGDGYVVTGQKIWISTAQVADKVLLLARTTPRDEVKRTTDGLSLFYTDLDRSRVEVRKIDKMGRHAVDSNKLFIDGLAVPADDLHRRGRQRLPIDPPRPESGAHPDRRRSGRHRPRGAARAAKYASERVVFGRPIGQNQGIQHPLAKCWMALEAADLMAMKAAALYDAGAAMRRRGQRGEISRRGGGVSRPARPR